VDAIVLKKLVCVSFIEVAINVEVRVIVLGSPSRSSHDAAHGYFLHDLHERKSSHNCALRGQVLHRFSRVALEPQNVVHGAWAGR